MTLTSAKSIKKRARKKQGVVIAATKPKLATKTKAISKKELNSFLALHVGDATDAYLRGLALRHVI